MLTKDDLMKLPKERLCELLLEEWNKKELQKPFDISVPKDVYIECRDCFHGGPCTNPHHDCVNCPRIFSDGISECGIGLTQGSDWITVHEAVMTQDGLILTSKNEQ